MLGYIECKMRQEWEVEEEKLKSEIDLRKWLIFLTWLFVIYVRYV